ncbi:hypothetical protein E2K98_29130 [Bacillus salipaludis]|uniref:Tyr recombinase domain-containing protein n=1 Tax=Bacillus salipaludis TaxID=2547811 RepID=A0A4R5VI81_9BACI|nr:hypothetical protein E2K98_29130 [Bacillus salipaludis]
MNTKTRKAKEVPLSTKTMKLLKEYMNESDDFGEDLLFLTYDGREMLSNTWRTRLHEVAELSEVKKSVRPYFKTHRSITLHYKWRRTLQLTKNIRSHRHVID